VAPNIKIPRTGVKMNRTRTQFPIVADLGVRPTKALAANLKVEILIFIIRHFDSEQPFY
jgi:hypothetical protein